MGVEGYNKKADLMVSVLRLPLGQHTQLHDTAFFTIQCPSPSI